MITVDSEDITYDFPDPHMTYNTHREEPQDLEDPKKDAFENKIGSFSLHNKNSILDTLLTSNEI